MTERKNAAPVMTEQEAANNVLTTATTVPQKAAQCQGNSKKSERHALGIGSKVYALAIKCYDEQLMAGMAQDKAGLASFIRQVDPAKYQVLAIMHDRDTVTDGIWAEAAVKPHYHVILRCVDRKSRVKVSTALNMLGIRFRPGTDDALWLEHGVETVGNFAGYATYLTHETQDAIRDAKEQYDVSEIISNLTPEGVEQVRDGYIRVSEIRKLTQDALISLDKEAYDLGYNFGDFEKWYDELPFSARSHAKMKVIRESYSRGVDARVRERNNVLRLCVFIQGQPNCGKSYASEHTLDGSNVLVVSGGGTGKFDNLRPDHDAIIIDDDVCPNLLNMSDNYMCRAYRRRSNNPVWAGRYLIVTSNKSFEQWLDDCHVSRENVEAVRSRFFVCNIITNRNGISELRCDSISDRGTTDERMARWKMFESFSLRFNAIIGTYTPSDKDSYSDPVADAYLYSPFSGFADYEAKQAELAEQEYMEWLAQQDEQGLTDEQERELEEFLARKEKPRPRYYG